MKTTLATGLFIMALTINGAYAQNISKQQNHDKMEKQMAMPPEQRAKEESIKAEKKLGLSADQKTKWEQAALVRINANKPFVEKLQGSTTPEERKGLHENIKKNGKEFDQTVNAMLSADQKTKWEAWKAEKRNNMEKKMKEKKLDEFED